MELHLRRAKLSEGHSSSALVREVCETNLKGMFRDRVEKIVYQNRESLSLLELVFVRYCSTMHDYVLHP